MGRRPTGWERLFTGDYWPRASLMRNVYITANTPERVVLMNDLQSNRRRRSHLVLGLFLLLVGGVLLAANLGYGIPWDILLYWPVVLMVLGLIGLVAPSRHMRRSSGMWLFVSGLYCQIGLTHWFGLGWWSAWPVFVIAAGIDLIFFKDEEKKCHEAQRGI